jgi:serine/threonine protein kinase
VSLENLFLNDENRIVLADFGCARKWAKGKRANFGNYRPGKWQYMCPEIYEWKPVYGELADVWSIGVCLFIMVTGKAPFRFPSKDDLNFVRIYNDKDFSRCDISDDCKDLLANILCPPDQRIKISDILRHPWMMFQSSSILSRNSSRSSSPYRRRSLTHVSPFCSPSASPGASPLSLSPREHMKSFVIPSPSPLFTRLESKHNPNGEQKTNHSHLLLKGTENKILASPQLNRRTFSMSTLKELRNSLTQLCLQQQQQNPLLR